MKRKLPVIIAILLVLSLAGCATGTPAGTTPENTAPHILTKEEVKAIVLAHAKVEEAAITALDVDLDEEEGEIFYDLEFDHENTEHDYRVDALSGKIIYNKAEPKEALQQPAETQPVNAQPEETQPAEETPAETKPKEEKPTATKTPTSSKKKIGVAAAKKAAFKHANVKASDAWDVEVDLDSENGKLVYEVSFDAGGYDYDYDIDAYTGKVVRSEKEKDN